MTSSEPSGAPKAPPGDGAGRLAFALAAAGVAFASRRPMVQDPVANIDRADESGLLVAEHEVPTNDGGTLMAYVCGEGDTGVVVLAHCWTGNATNWAPVTRRLVAKGCRVVRWDQRGHGRSSGGSAGHSVGAIGDDLACVLGELDLREVVLAGHSMGGMTIQSYFARHPADARDRIRAITLAATAASNPLPPLPGVVLSPIFAMARNLTDHPTLGRQFVRSSFGPSARRDHVEAARAHYVATTPEVVAHFGASMTRMDLRETNAEVTVPVQVLVGSRDPLTPPKLARELVESLPHAEIQMLDRLGHMLVFEAPETIAETILTQVQSVTPVP